jgi:hypothetical protein
VDLWPSIGGVACDFIESELVHGPGPVSGKSIELTPEEQRFIFSMYEVHPAEPCGRKHCNCVVNVGKFRYEWAIYCRMKGSRKSELAAWLTHFELVGPCRFGGWDAAGNPVAVSIWEMGGTADIPFAATAEDQAKDTAWSSFHFVAERCSYAHTLDITKDKVTVRQNGAGNARVVTSSSIARDGGRPTFTVEEEAHLWVLPELVELDRVLDYNLAKLGSNDPHGLKVSTMFGVGDGSVLESDFKRWEEDPDSGILLDIRSARDSVFDPEIGKDRPLNPKVDADILLGIQDAKGDAYWLDEYRIFRRFKRSKDAAIRYWWNKRAVSEKRAIDPDDWAAAESDRAIVPGEPICVGFDGSLYDDSTAVIVSCLSDGFQWPALIYYPDGTEEGVNALRNEVDRVIFDLSCRFKIVRMYCDPPHWGDQIARWQGDYGSSTVVSWWTNRDLAMSWATHRWAEGIATKTWHHAADDDFTKQVVNAHKRSTRIIVDKETGGYGWVPTKERQGSRNKVDACVASVLAYEARVDAIRGGAQNAKKRSGKVYAF